MRRLWMLCVLVLCLSQVGLAQGTPSFEVFGGASYFRLHASGAEAPEFVGVQGVLLCPPTVPSSAGCLEQRNINFGLYGWDASVTQNMNNWFGGDLDVSGVYATPKPSFFYPPVAIPTSIYTVMYGPRFTYRKSGRLTPFFHVLLGVARINGHNNQATIFTPLDALVPQGTSRSETAFALAPGGGIDMRIGHSISIRLIQLDYVMTRFYGQRQDNARASAGVVFRFGGL